MREALILIDFVNDIVDPDGAVAMFGTPKHVVEQDAIANANVVLKHARAQGTKVIWVRVCFAEGHPELEGLTAPFYVSHRENGWLVKGTWGTEFHPELQPAEGEPVVEKARINPFTNPSLEQELDGVDRIVLVGVSTNLAIEETVRNGAAKGYDVVVLEDCCASNNAEMHDFSVANIIAKFATVSNSGEYTAS
jgi:nicotinamidase-related amidase